MISMKHGILAQFNTTLLDSFETVYSFQGVATYTLNFVNHNEEPCAVSIAIIPKNGVLAPKHWLIKDELINNYKHLPTKHLANEGDRLVIKASNNQLSVTIQGVEND